MTESHNPKAFLENILEQVIKHLEEENARRTANCTRLRTENERLRTASRLNVVHVLTCLSRGAVPLTLQRQLEVQQACAGVVGTCVEQAEQAKLHTEEQYKEYSAAEELQRQAEQQYDHFTMAPYHDVAAEIDRLKAEKLNIQAKTASFVESKQTRRVQVEARIKEMEAEHKLYDQLVEINNEEVQQLALALQQARQQNEQSVNRVQELEISIAEIQQKLAQAKS